MLRPVLLLCGLATLATCQFESYSNVDNFTCDGGTVTSRELVTRTAETGTVYSPCYGDATQRYPKERVSGSKLIFINHENPFLLGYRLNIRDFQIAGTDRLYIGNGTEPFADNRRAIRQLTLFSNSTTDNLVYLREGKDGAILKVLSLDDDNMVDLLDYQQVYMDFYTDTDSEQGRGFFIDYTADVNKCLFTGDNVFCKNGGACVRVGFNTASCNCAGTGYEGAVCSVDINECNTGTNDCSANADCTNTNGRFICTCQAGYAGPGNTCVDIDECASSDPCGVTGNCSNSIGGFECVCSSGYVGGVEGPCSDINECDSGTNDCSANADCLNTNGGFLCTCRAGYTGPGNTCTDIDECALSDPCGVTGNCSNNIGGFDCVCSSGYTGGVGGPCIASTTTTDQTTTSASTSTSTPTQPTQTSSTATTTGGIPNCPTQSTGTTTESHARAGCTEEYVKLTNQWMEKFYQWQKAFDDWRAGNCPVS